MYFTVEYNAVNVFHENIPRRAIEMGSMETANVNATVPSAETTLKKTDRRTNRNTCRRLNMGLIDFHKTSRQRALTPTPTSNHSQSLWIRCPTPRSHPIFLPHNNRSEIVRLLGFIQPSLQGMFDRLPWNSNCQKQMNGLARLLNCLLVSVS